MNAPCQQVDDDFTNRRDGNFNEHCIYQLDFL
jgi:hypothetical protein